MPACPSLIILPASAVDLEALHHKLSQAQAAASLCLDNSILHSSDVLCQVAYEVSAAANKEETEERRTLVVFCLTAWAAQAGNRRL